MSAVEYEVVRSIGEKGDPDVHVGRPQAEPGQRYGRTALWLVVTGGGEWLACGRVVTVSRGQPRMIYDVEVPAFARMYVDMAVSRALDKWAEIERREQSDLDRLVQLHWLRCGHVSALERAQVEIARIDTEAAEIRQRIPVVP